MEECLGWGNAGRYKEETEVGESIDIFLYLNKVVWSAWSVYKDMSIK
jgi:hypothetical protein